MDKIEQEFFEAFGIEPELNCVNCTKFNDGESIYGTKGGCYDGSKETKKCYSLYPPITPEIVLELEKIILLISDDYNFSVGHFDNETRFLFCDKRLILENEDNLKDCILQSCIQLKHEIRDQLKELFNGK